MVSLAELKLHIRDEYKRNAAAQQRLRKHMAGVPPTANSTATAATPSLDVLAAADTSLSTQPVANVQVEDTDRDDSVPSSAGPAEGSLQSIADNLMAMVDDDEDIEPIKFPSSLSIKLSDLFDFKVDYWINSSEVAGNRGLQDELEFYELIDLDASGEIDTDVDVDGMSEAVLAS